MISLYFMNTDHQADQKIFYHLTSLLTVERKDQVFKLRFNVDRNLRICSDILLRCLICKILQVKNKDLIYLLNDYGKPYLANYPQLQYNCSHTKSAISIAISNQSVGVDIEKTKHIDFTNFKNIFTENEFSFLLAEPNNQNIRFFELWTKKESYIKCSGKGLSTPFNSFDVTNPVISGNMHTLQKDNYVISVCGADSFLERQPNVVSVENLLEMWFQYCV